MPPVKPKLLAAVHLQALHNRASVNVHQLLRYCSFAAVTISFLYRLFHYPVWWYSQMSLVKSSAPRKSAAILSLSWPYNAFQYLQQFQGNKFCSAYF